MTLATTSRTTNARATRARPGCRSEKTPIVDPSEGPKHHEERDDREASEADGGEGPRPTLGDEGRQLRVRDRLHRRVPAAARGATPSSPPPQGARSGRPPGGDSQHPTHHDTS